MPVVLLSWDSTNDNLEELFSVVDKFDLVYLELSEDANSLYNLVRDRIQCVHTFYISDLSSSDDASEKLKKIFNRFTDLKTGNVLIISHQDFFQKAGHAVAEWQPLSL
jgi:hypothetical protein